MDNPYAFFEKKVYGGLIEHKKLLQQPAFQTHHRR